MTQEHEELLLKDLCGRLPYGVICDDGYGNVLELNSINKPNTVTFKCSDKTFWTTDLDKCKPYLFPLSSMTEEQKNEISKRYNYIHYYGLCIEITNHSEGYWDNDTSCNLQDYLWLEDWFNKNHFDYRGLIPMGLAKDATNLNIYG